MDHLTFTPNWRTLLAKDILATAGLTAGDVSQEEIDQAVGTFSLPFFDTHLFKIFAQSDNRVLGRLAQRLLDNEITEEQLAGLHTVDPKFRPAPDPLDLYAPPAEQIAAVTDVLRAEGLDAYDAGQHDHRCYSDLRNHPENPDACTEGCLDQLSVLILRALHPIQGGTGDHEKGPEHHPVRGRPGLRPRHTELKRRAHPWP